MFCCINFLDLVLDFGLLLYAFSVLHLEISNHFSSGYFVVGKWVKQGLWLPRALEILCYHTQTLNTPCLLIRKHVRVFRKEDAKTLV